MTDKERLELANFLNEVIEGNESYREVLRQAVTEEIDKQIISSLRKQLDNEPDFNGS